MTFADRCVHCDYHAKTENCCFCGKDPYAMEKTREQHLAEIGGLDEDI
jgi:ribosomal protein L37E